MLILFTRADSRQSTTDVNNDSRLPSATASTTSTQCLTVLGYLTNMAIHAVMIGFTIFVTFLAFSQGIQLFSWHPMCMLIGVSIIHTRCTQSHSKKFPKGLFFGRWTRLLKKLLILVKTKYIPLINTNNTRLQLCYYKIVYTNQFNKFL